MKLILVNSDGRSRTINLKVHMIVKLSLLSVLFCIPLAVGWLIGDYRSQTIPGFLTQMSSSLADEVDMQAREIHEFKQDTMDKLKSLNIQIGKMQARIIRVETVATQVGERVNLNVAEFNFENEPGVGGPANPSIVLTNDSVAVENNFDDQVPTVNTLLLSLERLNQKVNQRLWQIELLENLLQNSNAQKQEKLSGSPIPNGWLSSKFGYRSDPFSGLRAWHNGVDIASKEGSNVLSIASGVVTFAGRKEGYGNLVEIKHHSDIITRYGHNKDIKVKVGDVINKAQVIATVGSTGRSTGPHTHFEVYKNGHAVDPAIYIQKYVR